MSKTGPKKIAQFRYWHLRRKGVSQSAIAKRFKITRQAVSKSIKLEEREMTFKLLDTAQMSGILVEWYDPKKGVLIGVTPQLENLACIMLVDVGGKIRIFFDQDRNKDKGQRRLVMRELASILKQVLDVELSSKDKFNKALDMIVRG